MGVGSPQIGVCFFLLNIYHLSFSPLSWVPPGLIMRTMMPLHLPSSYGCPDSAPFTDGAEGSP